VIDGYVLLAVLTCGAFLGGGIASCTHNSGTKSASFAVGKVEVRLSGPAAEVERLSREILSLPAPVEAPKEGR
jgi:hypothetical protein